MNAASTGGHRGGSVAVDLQLIIIISFQRGSDNLRRAIQCHFSFLLSASVKEKKRTWGFMSMPSSMTKEWMANTDLRLASEGVKALTTVL
jgi:hypothetical protein